MGTKIQYVDETINPIQDKIKGKSGRGYHCTKCSPGCLHCYAEGINNRFGNHLPFHARHVEFELIQSELEKPLKWKKPRRIFIQSMGDLFHEDVQEGWIDTIFLIISLNKNHTFFLLTKRPERMKEYLSSPLRPSIIAKKADNIFVRQQAEKIPFQIKELPEYPNYFIGNNGVVYTTYGSSVCLFCGKDTGKYAKKLYCSHRCKENAYRWRRKGKPLPFDKELMPMKPMPGEDGHSRVMFYLSDGRTVRELVHRLVLIAFDRLPINGEQCCHRNGDATYNHITNLRWGSHSDNWEDRKRHGNGGPFNGEWPLSNIICGVTVCNQEEADEKIPILLQIPGFKKWVSVEPILEAVNLGKLGDPNISWVVAGCETGPGRGFGGLREANSQWFRSLAQQCRSAGVPYFQKKCSGPTPEDLMIYEFPE